MGKPITQVNTPIEELKRKGASGCNGSCCIGGSLLNRTSVGVNNFTNEFPMSEFDSVNSIKRFPSIRMFEMYTHEI